LEVELNDLTSALEDPMRSSTGVVSESEGLGDAAGILEANFLRVGQRPVHELVLRRHFESSGKGGTGWGWLPMR
jgi:hypothetical protein